MQQFFPAGWQFSLILHFLLLWSGKSQNNHLQCNALCNVQYKTSNPEQKTSSALIIKCAIPLISPQFRSIVMYNKPQKVAHFSVNVLLIGFLYFLSFQKFPENAEVMSHCRLFQRWLPAGNVQSPTVESPVRRWWRPETATAGVGNGFRQIGYWGARPFSVHQSCLMVITMNDHFELKF